MKKYLPLFVFIAVAALAAYAIPYPLMQLKMLTFMGLLFCNFSMLKFFNLQGFVEGFQKYDAVARRVTLYAYLFPFIELLMGLSFLSMIGLAYTLPFTFVWMMISAVSVIASLRQGLNIKCVCMGSVLDVPLSTVTLVEDLGMGAMALWLYLTF
jgi:hypothetical protein